MILSILDYSLKLNLTIATIKEIIEHYTRESGVRQLERYIDKIFRRILIDGETPNKIDVTDYLGNYKYRFIKNEHDSYIGIVNALGYTPYGGCLQKTSAICYPGAGKLTLTGMLGDTIKESAEVAISYIKANSNIMDIDNTIFNEKDFHIHFEGGGIAKDGPSAGVAIMSSLISLIKEKPIESTISMTGEITLRG